MAKTSTTTHPHAGAMEGPAAGTMVDPVCGMSLDAAGPLRHEHDGTTYVSCRERCRDQFREDPAAYVGGGADHGETPPSPPPRPVRVYTCPLHAEVRASAPGSCPKWGMALEPEATQTPATRTEYVCPTHPEVVREEPGSCPICGMALEPRTVTLEDQKSPELVDMTRRFWVSVALAVPLLLTTMPRYLPGAPLERIGPASLWSWLELVQATPVVLWGGWPFFVRGWRSVVTRNLNMFMLIALGGGGGVRLQPDRGVLFRHLPHLLARRWSGLSRAHVAPAPPAHHSAIACSPGKERP